MIVKAATKTVIAGSTAIGLLFLFGVGFLIWLNLNYQGHQFRDIGIVFAATIAASGAIIASFIAFKASHHIEAEKDYLNRCQKMDNERTQAEVAIVTLHVAATFLDGIYQQIRDRGNEAKYGIDQNDYLAYKHAIAAMPIIPNPFPLTDGLDVRFMRLEEQQAVRSIQSCIGLLESSVKKAKEDIQLSNSERERLIQELGENEFFMALKSGFDQVHKNNKMLFGAIVPYLNSRKASAIPDEIKLRMLLGDLRVSLKTPINTLDEATEEVRLLASRLLRENVHAADIQNMFQAIASGITDEDSIPIK